jgi:hypothetical protein
VSKVQPWLTESLFRSTSGAAISTAAVDLYPKLALPPASDSLQHRPDEPAEVKTLQKKTQFLADSMRNFVAVQTFAWGSEKNKVPVAVAGV